MMLIRNEWMNSVSNVESAEKMRVVMKMDKTEAVKGIETINQQTKDLEVKDHLGLIGQTIGSGTEVLMKNMPESHKDPVADRNEI